MTADRTRRLATWASAVARPPTATPPTVPWEGAGASGTGGATRVSRELAGDALRWAAGRAADLRAALGPDPARLHARRLRQARRSTRLQSYAAGGLGAVSAGAYPLIGLEPVVLAGGGLAAVAAGGAALAGMELRRLRRLPVPQPRAARPPRDSPARVPLDRLAERERALHDLLAHLGEAADEPRRVAAEAARGLRELGARLSAVDRARRATRGTDLDTAVTALAARLHDGVESYAALVVAAADAVAADARLRAPDPRLREATDALAGLAAGLRDIAA